MLAKAILFSPSATTTYAVTVTDDNACTATDVVTIAVDNNLTVTCLQSINDGPFEENCQVDICEGSKLELSATPAIETGYSWTGPNGFTASTREILVSNNITSAEEGDYIVTYTDGGGCIGSNTVTVTVSGTPTASVTTTNVSCGLDNGTITFTFQDYFRDIQFSLGWR